MNPRTPYSTPTKIVIILQLCLGFSALLWMLGAAFLKPHYQARSDLLLIEAAMGKTDSVKSLDPRLAASFSSRRAIQATLYDATSFAEKKRISALFQDRQALLEESGLKKLEMAASFLSTAPPLEWGWIFLSIAIPIALLLKKPIAKKGVWALPTITLFFALFNLVSKPAPSYLLDKALIPAEKELVQESFQGKISEQKAALEKGFQNYLITHFLNEMPSEDPTIYERQLARGEFIFLNKRVTTLPEAIESPFWEVKSPFILLLYVSWNLFFAIFIYKRSRIIKPSYMVK